MKTAVEWLAEKYDYVYWMVKRDEISPALAEEWKKHYLEQAKKMFEEQVTLSHINGQSEFDKGAISENTKKLATEYYNQTFKSE
jgi:hypothetical protein